MLLAAILSLACVAQSPGQTQPAAAATPAEVGGQPATAAATASLPALKESMVLVAVRFNGEIYGVPGVVLHRNGDRALVAARELEPLQRVYANVGQVVSGPDYFVLWGEGSQRQAVRAERVSAFERNAFCVVAAPADRLPPPVKLDASPELTPQMPVYVMGFETDRFVTPPAFAAFAEKGVLGQVNLGREGQVTAVELSCPEAPTLSLAVVAAASGQVVGFCWGQRPSKATDGSQYLVSPPDFLTKLLEPQIAFLTFGFESGDTKRVVYEFVAVVNDPCQRIRTPKLTIQPQEYGSRGEEYPRERRPGIPYVPPPEPPPLDTLPEAITLDLKNQPLSPAVQLQHSWLDRFGDGHTWVARYPAENPGMKYKYLFRAQVSYVDQVGSKIYLPQRTLEFDLQNRKGDAVPNIPGLDGKPVDYPRSVQLADGCYRVTSESTRVDPDTTGVEINVPQPRLSGKLLASNLSGAGGRRAVMLDVAPGQKAPAVFSPDGAWLYLVDANNVIRKISTSDFIEEVYLEAAGSCTSLAYSRAGLVVAIEGTNVIHVLDPSSLKVKRSIPTDGVRTLAASPATDIGFAEGRVDTRDPQGSSQTYTQLLMLDFEKGCLLHRIKNGPRFYLRIGSTDFHMGFGTPYLTQDGAHLYLGDYSYAGLYRFRVDGEDLIYERAWGLSPSCRSDGIVVSQKSGFPHYFVYDVEQMDQPKFEFDVGRAGPQAVDPKSGSIYVDDHQGNMCVFDSHGAQVANLPVPNCDVSYLLPHPGGRRLLGWGRRAIVYYDLELDRLSRVLPRDPGDLTGGVPASGELQPLTPGNCVATTGRTMRELNPRGELVQTIDVPPPPDAESVSEFRDPGVARDGSLYVMVDYKQKSTRSKRSCIAFLGADRKEWRYRSLPNKKDSSLAYVGDLEVRPDGKVAVLLNWDEAFLLDPRSASDPPMPIPAGKCMTFGPDGTYYTSGGSGDRYTIYAYDLETLSKTREIKTEIEPSTIAVDGDGSIFAANSTAVTKILPEGGTKRLMLSRSGGDSIYDLDILPDGTLVIGSRSGKFFRVDRDLKEESLLVTAEDGLAVWVAGIPGGPSPGAADR